MALSRRTQRLEQFAKLLSIGLIGLLALSVGSVYLPFSMVQQARQQVAERQQQLDKARQAPQQLRLLQQQHENALRELRFLEQGVSQAAYIPTMLKQIEQTARQLQLEIVAVRPQQNQQQSGQTTQSGSSQGNQQGNGAAPARKAYEEQLIEVSLQGRFWSLMSFLRQLDEFPKILAVQSLNAQAKPKIDQPNANPDLEIRMTIKAFIFPSTRLPLPAGQGMQPPLPGGESAGVRNAPLSHSVGEGLGVRGEGR